MFYLLGRWGVQGEEGERRLLVWESVKKSSSELNPSEALLERSGGLGK